MLLNWRFRVMRRVTFWSINVWCVVIACWMVVGVRAAGAVPAKVATGTNHMVAVLEDGTLWVWGWNNIGQLGDGTTTTRTSPTQIGTATNWSNIAAGKDFTIATKSDGTLWAWGSNGQGQLGDGTTTTRISPTQIGTATIWSGIAAGAKHSLATRGDGTIWAWGGNSRGQLGDGTTVSKTSPIQIGSSSNWASMAAGGYHSVAVRSDGTLWAWGDNRDGEIGRGFVSSSPEVSPVQVGSATTWSKVGAGGGRANTWQGNPSGREFGHSMGIMANGTLWTWGSNNLGQLGNGLSGSVAFVSAPTQIGTDTSWAKVAGSHYSSQFGFSAALKADGTMWAWGSNSSGQLGDGSTVDSSSPTRISLNSKVTIDVLGINFGNTVLGSTATQNVSVVNSSGVSVNMSSGTAPSPFNLGAGDCGIVLPSSSCSFPVSFSPTSAGSATGTLMVNSDAFGAGRSIPLTGTGVTPTSTPTATVTPVSPTSTPTTIPPTPTPTPSATDSTDDGGEEDPTPVLKLKQLGKVLNGAARLQVDSYSVSDGKNKIEKKVSVSVACAIKGSSSKAKLTTSTKGQAVALLKKAKKRMKCKATAKMLGEAVSSNGVTLK